MSIRFGAICEAGAGAIVVLGLLCAPVRADTDIDVQKRFFDCMGERAIDLCAESLSSKPTAGETAKPPTFDTLVSACTAERRDFTEMVRARNLAAGRTAAYAEKRVVRNTRRLERMVHRLYDECMDTKP